MRFISNRSTGYMGYRIAEESLKRKHKVVLISGPTNILPPKVNKNIFIHTASELLKELKKEILQADCLVMCAAVGDFRVKHPGVKKIKRKRKLCLELIPNEDILQKLGKFHKHKLFVGFSLETENLMRNSYLKLKNKNLDLIVANRFTKYHNPFGNNRLDIDIIDKKRDITKIRNKNKNFIAHVLLDKLEELWYLERDKEQEARDKEKQKKI